MVTTVSKLVTRVTKQKLERASFLFINVPSRLGMFSRIIRVSSLSSHYASLRAKSTKPIPIITKYPVRIGIKYPSWDVPAFIEFDSKKHIKTFFSERKQFLMDPRTGNCILPDETHRIDPSVTYDIVGTDLSYHHEKSLSPDQVWDRIFEGKTTRALRDWFISEGVKFAELPRVVKDPGTGLDVEEWELIIQIVSDGTLVFLETKYRMWKVSYQFIFIIHSNLLYIYNLETY